MQRSAALTIRAAALRVACALAVVLGLGNPDGHAEHDLGRGLRLLAPVARCLSVLVGVLALQKPRRRRPLAVLPRRGLADGREERPLVAALRLFLAPRLTRDAVCPTACSATGTASPR